MQIAIVICLYIITMWTTEVNAAPGLVTQGKLDLRSWDFKSSGQVSLRGEWEFYWEKLFLPEDFESQAPAKENFLQVPANWSFQGYPSYGFATYRLQVRLSQPHELAIRFPWIQASAKIYIDGELYDTVGRIHTDGDPQFYSPKVKEDYYIFKPRQADFDIVIQVANFTNLISGMAGTPTLGTVAAVKSTYIKDISIVLFFSGCIFIMGIYHFCLYALRTKARSALYFGLICVTVSLYMFASHLPSVTTFIPSISGNNATRFYLVWTLNTGLFAFFFHELYPSLFPRRLAQYLTASTFGLYGIVLAYDFELITIPLFIFQGITGSFALYSLFAIIKAACRNEDGAGILIGGVIILVLTIIHDMFKYLYDSPNLGGFGLLSFIICQSFLLARRFSNAFKQVELSEKEIRQLSQDLSIQNEKVLALNENLENLVDEKTRDIRSIMSHIQLGIFAITAKGYRIHKDYSLHLKEIFERGELTDVDARELLFANNQLSTDEVSQAISTIDASLGEDVLAFETNKHCLPSELRFQSANGQIRILEISWNPMINENEIVEKLLVTVKDATELRKLQEESYDRREELEFIGELLNVPAHVFNRFISTSLELLAENRKLLNSRSLKLKNMEVLKVLFINMHTVKGAARSLYFKKMTKIFHDVEQYYALLQRKPEVDWNIEKMTNDLKEAESIVKIYESINQKKLGRKTFDEQTIEISDSELSQIYKHIEYLRKYLDFAPTRVTSLIHNLQTQLFPHLFVPVGELIHEICQSLDTLSKDLEKPKPRLIIEDDGLYLNRQGEMLLRKIFIHILRNSMDHGLENAAERLGKRKQEQGEILISFKSEDDNILIIYRDDGRGLNINRIRESAKIQGLVVDPDSLTIKECADLIFQSGLSTAVRVNDISGRGVGMGAIKTHLQTEGGDIQIQLDSEINNLADYYPFYFTIKIPKSLFARPTTAPVSHVA